MKKNIYWIITLVAVVVSGFLIATRMYKKSQESQEAAQSASGANSPQSQAMSSEMSQRLMRSDSWSMGPSVARVSVVEFLDPQCEACRAMHPIVKKVLAEFEGQVHFTVRYMPFHPHSKEAAVALEAAGAQGKFWEALALLFEKQNEWGGHDKAKPELIPSYMKELGLDMKRFTAELANPAFAQKVERDRADGEALGVQGTPSFFVNGRMLPELGYEPLKAQISEELKK